MLFNKAGLESFIFKKPGPAISISEKLFILSKKISLILMLNLLDLSYFFFQEPLQYYMINQN